MTRYVENENRRLFSISATSTRIELRLHAFGDVDGLCFVSDVGGRRACCFQRLEQKNAKETAMMVEMVGEILIGARAVFYGMYIQQKDARTLQNTTL